MLNTKPTTLAYDDMYEALITTHQGLSTGESHALNARLVLLLANQINDLDTLKEAFGLARRTASPDAGNPAGDKKAITPVMPTHAGA